MGERIEKQILWNVEESMRIREKQSWRGRGRGGEEHWGERRRLPTVACGVLDVGMNRDPGGERVRVVTVESQSQRRGDWVV